MLVRLRERGALYAVPHSRQSTRVTVLSLVAFNSIATVLSGLYYLCYVIRAEHLCNGL